MISAQDPVDFEGIERSSRTNALVGLRTCISSSPDEQAGRPTILNTEFCPPVRFGCSGHCSAPHAGQSAAACDPSSQAESEQRLTSSCDRLVPVLAVFEPPVTDAVETRRRSICATAPPPILARSNFSTTASRIQLFREHGDLARITGLVDLHQELRRHPYRHGNPL